MAILPFFVVACLGFRCRPRCPQGHYGEQCDKTCTCNADVCDDVSGCATAGKNSCDKCSNLKITSLLH